MSLSKCLRVQGGQPLNGTVSISGAKNAILPLMAASLLTSRPIRFYNVPDISDVRAMILLLRSYGAEVREDWGVKSLLVRAIDVRGEPQGPNAEIGRTFRASILVLGPLLVRCHEAVIYAPGGDDISSQGRGYDFHVAALEAMGATVNVINIRPGKVKISASRQSSLQAPRLPIQFSKVSVGATQHLMITACAALGQTTIEQTSIEPETMDLVKLLRAMGASITVYEDQRRIVIFTRQTVSRYSSGLIEHTVIPDRIEAGTYAIAAAITNGSITLRMNVDDAQIQNMLQAEFWRLLAASSVEITRLSRGTIRVASNPYAIIQPVSVRTQPFPGFPSDMHPQWAALMCFSNGECWLEETVFDARFKYVTELQKIVGERTIGQLGNKVCIDGRQREAPLVSYILCNDVTAPDIRAGASLVLAALARPELTVVRGVPEIERGYENFVGKLQQCGADISIQE